MSVVTVTGHTAATLQEPFVYMPPHMILPISGLFLGICSSVGAIKWWHLAILNYPCVSQYLESCGLFMNYFQIINVFVSVFVCLNCTSVVFLFFTNNNGVISVSCPLLMLKAPGTVSQLMNPHSSWWTDIMSHILG